jgi:uncharacterized LabA/DUF88 family protein
MVKTAILVDGGFYRQVIKKFTGDKSPRDRAAELINYCYSHLKDGEGNQVCDLYRIFYYDCPPLDKKLLHPLTHKQIDYSETALHKWMTTFLYEMTKQRKVAMRLGFLSEAQQEFALSSSALKKLSSLEVQFCDLQEKDFYPDVKQKGVDMKIGIDIASLAYKRLVDRIVLIAGDSDFVPASKLARREGIDFVLDPLWQHINPDLFEHIDGRITKLERPVKNRK